MLPPPLPRERPKQQRRAWGCDDDGDRSASVCLAPSAGAGAAAGQQGTPQSGAQVHAPPVIILHNQEANQQKASLNYKHRTIKPYREQNPTETQSLNIVINSYIWMTSDANQNQGS